MAADVEQLTDDGLSREEILERLLDKYGAELGVSTPAAITGWRRQIKSGMFRLAKVTPGYVYFIRDGYDFFKIGKSSRVPTHSRFSCIQVGNPRPLTLVAYFACADMNLLEDACDTIAASEFDRAEGEWFFGPMTEAKATQIVAATGVPVNG